jgi:single-strand DNA-binding protein
LKYGKYTDPSGVEKNTVDIIATELQLLGGRESGSAQGSNSHADEGNHGAPRASAPRSAPASQAKPSKSGFDDMDDDIPF